ncbi:DEAD/DEAH box helicase family protein [Rheinheimera texasensis]|uniref:DEAD/DEAH box helicase family protein n=1 Tax=Rheinheimera texasensis TaxID=306205 RepID=UPI000B24B4BC|nr:DEAD/DEAH box helicase family protein [Rheinheimera texasensis]
MTDQNNSAARAAAMSETAGPAQTTSVPVAPAGKTLRPALRFQLRDYQQQAVTAVLQYFRRLSDPAVLVLPTGAGKSLVIAELARLARGRVLVLTHVKELVSQNQQKYQSYGLEGGIYAAGLGLKQTSQQVIFASVQSVSRNLADFCDEFSLLIIDECHRVPLSADSSYRTVISHLQLQNAGLKVLGLTATPYRLGQGFIYQFHYQGTVRGDADCFFRWCIFELSIRVLLQRQYLTPPNRLDCAVLSYDFTGLKPANNGHFREAELNQVINHYKRVTPQIIAQVQQYAQNRRGVMIFAATSAHAREILALLPPAESALILSATPSTERAALLERFKQQQLKYLVNVAVLTTGFDAPHVDLIAILRPTESLSLYQQIVGRGLRLSPGKTDCLVLDYAGNLYDLYSNDPGPPPPDSQSVQVTVPCPLCQYPNQFWGKQNPDGLVLEHYGRQCQGMRLDEQKQPVPCGFRFKARFCPECGTEHDIAARSCSACGLVLVDPDKKLQDALKLKDALILYPNRLEAETESDAQGQPRLRLRYLDAEGQHLQEFFRINSRSQIQRLCAQVLPPFIADRHRPFKANTVPQLDALLHRLQPPAVVIAQKDGRFWKIRDKLFEINKFN